MPKILRILNRFNIGGPVYNATYLTKYLPQEYETLLVGGEKDISEASALHISENLGIKPIIVPEMRRKINPALDYKAYLKIKNIIAEFKPDIVHTHASKSGFLGRQAAFKMNVPIIVHTFHGHVFHSYFGKAKTSFFKSLERKLAKKTSAIVAISEIQKQELSIEHKICSPEKVEIIPLGFDFSKFQENQTEKRNVFRQQYNLDEDTVAIGIIGRLVQIKNHDFFLEVIKRQSESCNQKFKAFIIGGGELESSLKTKVYELGLNDMVVFTSWVKDVDTALAGLDVIALTSHNEGTPVSLIEAQAANKPVISTNVGGVENVLIKDESGYIVKKRDLENYSLKLKMLIENKQLRNQFGMVGRNFVQKKYHYDRLVKDADALYKKLLKKHQP